MQADAVPYADHGSPENGYLDPSITVPAQRLARHFEGRFAGYGGYRLRAAGSKVMQMLLDEGINEDILAAEIGNPARPRDMKLWDFPNWARQRAALIERADEDGQLSPFAEAWLDFEAKFKRSMPANQPMGFMDAWRDSCLTQLGSATTYEELAAGLDAWLSDPRRREPKFSSVFWPRNAWASIAEHILTRRKRRPTTIRLDDKGQPPAPLPAGYSSYEASRRVAEAQRRDPKVSAADVIAAYKRELEQQ